MSETGYVVLPWEAPLHMPHQNEETAASCRLCDYVRHLQEIAKAARAVSHTDPSQHRATDWGAYVATIGQRLFELRLAVDSLARVTDARSGGQE